MGSGNNRELPIIGQLADEWDIIKFGDALIGKTRNGVYKSKEFHGRGVKIVNMGELFGNPRLHNIPMKRIELSKKDEKFLLKKGDLLFARRSLVAEGAGKCSIICDASEPTTFESSIISARPDPRIANAVYLYYLFNSPYGRYILQSIRRQVAVAGITGKDLMELEIPLPPLPEQRAIAHILGTLDDKIELNRRMNATLEAMAQAIFKSWFVDFDPVRAKAEGRQPEGMDAETAALFPDEFEVVDGREVPKGWRVHGLDKIAKFLNGLALQKYPPEGNDYLPVIKIAQLRKGNTEGADKASPHVDPAYIIDDGDVLFSWSGSLMVILWAGGRGALNQHLFKVTSDRYPKWFYYLWIKHHLPEFQSIASGKTTTMGHIQRNHLSDAKVFVPPSDQLVVMDRIISQVISMIITNNVQSRTLAEIRDTLLPKLISGEIRVPINDEQIEEAIKT